MNIAVMVYSYAGALERGQTDLPRIIHSLRELGIDSVELMHSLIRPEELPAIRKALAETRMAVVCSDVRVKHAVAGFELAASLGAKMVMVTPSLDVKGFTPEAARAGFCDALRELLPLARKLGLTVTIENLGILAGIYGRSEDIASICDQVGPELRVTFDAGNFLLAGEDAGKALERLTQESGHRGPPPQPRLAHVHFKDWKLVPAGAESSLPGTDGRYYQGAALGEGVVDLRGTLQQLRRLGYDGTISVEYEGPQDPHDAVRRGVQFVRALLEQT